MEDPEILELYEVRYSDFVLLSSDYINAPSSLEAPELERLNLIQSNIMKTLGPMGSGLLAINGAPNVSSLSQLLIVARKLALLDPDQRKRLFKVNVPLKDKNFLEFSLILSFIQSN